MPAILTHYTFSKINMRDPSSPYFDAINLGSQGPDPFFFYGVHLPFLRKEMKQISSFGSSLHHMDISEVYPYLFEYANQSEEKDLLYAYIEGVFLHYVVDRNCHPYIFVRAGCPLVGTKEDKKWGGPHAMFEGLLDFLLGKKEGTYTTKTDACLKIEKGQLLSISKMWKYVNDKTLKRPIFSFKTFYYAVKDYAFALRLLNRPNWFSNIWVRLLVGKMGVPYGLHMQKKMPKEYQGLDFLNEQREEWPDLFDGHPRNESFLDLLENAKDDYHKACLLIDRAKKGEDIRKELSDFVGKKDHDGAIDQAPKRHRKPIWPNLG